MCPGELKADINETLEAFEHILHLYRSGLHLDNLPPSVFTGNSSTLLSFLFDPPFFLGEPAPSRGSSAPASVFISYLEKKKMGEKNERWCFFFPLGLF